MSDLDARAVAALERIAAALERIAAEPSGRLAPRRSTRRPRADVPAQIEDAPDDLTRARARRLLSRAGIEVG